MPRPLTALILTPSLGGEFFGDLILGVAREIVAADGRMVVIETRQEFLPRDEAGEQVDFATPVAWSETDGVVSITTAAGASYLQPVRESGKPVVLLSSTQMKDFEAPNARPDNHQGTVAAVEHLIEHGHTRIGFVGNMGQQDIRERFDAYRQTLESHDITVEQEMFFAVLDNSEAGGAAAAINVFEAKTRPTALMVATDRNAIGLMRELKSVGVDVPGDIAIVGFDNVAAGTFSRPTLTTVDPHFEEVAALAGRLLVNGIKGEELSNATVTPESAALIVRESCGCAAKTDGGDQADADEASEVPTELVRDGLHDLLERELRTGDEETDRQTATTVEAIAEEAVRLLEKGDETTTLEIDAFTASLLELTSNPRTLRQFTEVMTDWANRIGHSSASTTGSLPSVSARVAAALWKAQSGALLRQMETTEAAIGEQYVVDAGLLETGGADPRNLKWLDETSVVAATLALWEEPLFSGLLKIVGDYDCANGGRNLIGTVVPGEDFPPESLVARAAPANHEACVVLPVSTPKQDWGLLAVVAQIDPTTERETFQHWAALLCAALESQSRQEEVRRNALFDNLTRLPNRHLFVQQLEKAIARWRRSRMPYSVLFLDLDGFKLINDSLGHQMGDRVLKTVGSEISAALRSVDTAARFGGDEFVILLSDTEAGRAMVAAKRLQAKLDKVRDYDGHEIVTRVSIGIASSAVEYANAEDVLRDADAAMYRAKSSEPGTVAFFDAPMHESAVRRAELAKDVLRALQTDQFEVHYQPIVNLATGQTDRFEALVRWRHPDRGLIEPSEFLGDIEETSLIIQLGHRVLDDVCGQMAEWGSRVANVSINISDKEFWSQDLLSHVLATLERNNLAPDLLTLEITESVLMRRPEQALRIMQKLHDAGIRLHIDQFGTGFSSLETLHRFPVEAFKIDRSFIQTLTSTGDSAELISSLVKLGKALGLSVVAEGVETEEQLEYLQKLGCATGQGFLFMPAVTAERAGELLGHPLRAEDPV